MTLVPTGSYTTWTDLSTNQITLPGGNHVLKIVMETCCFNLNYVTVDSTVPTSTPTLTPTATATPTYTATPTITPTPFGVTVAGHIKRKITALAVQGVGYNDSTGR